MQLNRLFFLEWVCSFQIKQSESYKLRLIKQLQFWWIPIWRDFKQRHKYLRKKQEAHGGHRSSEKHFLEKNKLKQSIQIGWFTVAMLSQYRGIKRLEPLHPRTLSVKFSTVVLDRKIFVYQCILLFPSYLPFKKDGLLFNKRPTSPNCHLSIRDCIDFLSEGLIFTYQQPHHRINKNQQWHRKKLYNP